MTRAIVREWKQRIAEQRGGEVLALSGKLRCQQGTGKGVSDTWEGKVLLQVEVTAVCV